MKNISKIVNSISELKDVKIIKNIIFVSGKKNNTNNTMITEQFEYKFEKVAKEVYKKLSWLIK